MGEVRSGNTRRAVVWPQSAYDLVRNSQDTTGLEFSSLASKLVKETGNSRWACRRFLQSLGVRANRPQRSWTTKERQDLLKLIKERSVGCIARMLGRSPASIWHMLRRLGVSTKIEVEGFTKYQLAEALHVRVEKVQSWIDGGRLKVEKVKRGEGSYEIIKADDFTEFCKKHGKDVVGPRLKFDRLEFVRMYVFPPSHTEMLAVRESKKERRAYEAQLRGEIEESGEPDPDDFTEDEDTFDRTA